MKLKQAVKEAELIVLDFDGSIVNSLDVFLESFQKALLAYNKKCTIAEVKNNLGMCSYVEIRKNLVPKSYKVISRMLKGTSRQKIRKAHAYFQKIVLDRTPEIDAFEDAPAAIMKLGKIKKVALLTNSSRKYTQVILKRLKLMGCFQKIIYGDSGFKDKAAGLKCLMGQLGARPEKTIYVGDAPLDIKTAQKAGCISVSIIRWYSRAELREEKPDFIISRLTELVT